MARSASSRPSLSAVARDLIDPPLDRAELEIGGGIVEHWAVAQDRAVEPAAQPDLDRLQPALAGAGARIMQPRLRQPGEQALLAITACLDIGLDPRPLQPLQRLGQPGIGTRRMVGAGDREQVVRGKDEILRPSSRASIFAAIRLAM